MMANKRKANSTPMEPPTSNRRRTHSNGSLKETQALHVKSLRPRRAAGASGSSKEHSKSKAMSSPDSYGDDDINFLGSSPSKANTVIPPEDPSDDDMDLLGPSSSKEHTRQTTPPVTPRPSVSTKETPRKPNQIVEVVITPRSIKKTPQSGRNFAADSPSPSSRARNGTQTAKLSEEHPARMEKGRISRSASPSDPSSPSSQSPPPPLSLPHSSENFASQPLPELLPSHLRHDFQAQKVAVLRALQHPPLFVDDDESSAFSQLSELLNGTTQRNEGNSCLVLGPRGSGKSRLVDRVLESLPSTSTASPIVVRLSAHCQTNDRLAMREIARQVQQQVGSDLALPALSGKEEEEVSPELDDGRADVDLPPPSHLPTLVSALPALGRPVVVVLEAFDGFAAHARQALLYCLFDTVQSCRGGAPMAAVGDEIIDDSTGQVEVEGETVPPDGDHAAQEPEPQEFPDVAKGEHGLLVIGVTSRVDCLTLLEKRVKSRFSHRVMRVKTLAGLNDFLNFARRILCVDPDSKDVVYEEWKDLWTISVEKFLTDRDVRNTFNETFAFVKDIRMLCRLLISPVVALTSSSPWLKAAHLLSSASVQRPSTRFPFLSTLSYPHISLLIAAVHSQTSGNDTFNLEMLYDSFLTQVRTSAAAPVQIAGSAIGMVKIPRNVIIGAFEHLVATRVFQPIVAPAPHITREFVKYRCVADRDEIRAAVEHLGQTNLKKWFHKAQ